MSLFPSEPIYDKTGTKSETINHNDFKQATEKEKNKILYEMAKKHYEDGLLKPFNFFFPGYSFEELFKDKTVLDLGCFCGGKAVAFAEKWNVKNMYGIDVNKYFITSAQQFSSGRNNKNINYHFDVGYGEQLPYKDKFFDAIITNDVLEHVQSIKTTLQECKRIMKPNGKLYAVFPSYYLPFDGAHLAFVTKTPCIQWFFKPETLNQAFNEIIESRGDNAYWYRHKKINDNTWEQLIGGIGINGITFGQYKTLVNEIGFSKTEFLRIPLLAVSNVSVKYPQIKYIVNILKPLLAIDKFQDYLSHRIVSVSTV